MPKRYFANNESFPYPTSREMALENNSHMYYSVGKVCPGFNHGDYLTHVTDESHCRRCSLEGGYHPNGIGKVESLNEIRAEHEHDGVLVHTRACKHGAHFYRTRQNSDTCLVCDEIKEADAQRRQKAAETGEPQYEGWQPCNKCKEVSYRSTATGKCTKCAKEASPRQAAVAAGLDRYPTGETCPDCNAPLMKRVNNSAPIKCECKTNRNEDRRAAVSLGLTTYPNGEHCPGCGAPLMKRVDNGTMAACGCGHSKRGSDRQSAIAAGEKWYRSAKPCKHCGELSERYVANGRCRSCGK